MNPISDEQVSAALAAWYPGEWPDDPIFDAPTGVVKYGGRPWRDQCMDEMRAALEAAFSQGNVNMTREETLILLIEECGEVIQAATKCLRFGWDRNQPEYGINCDVLAYEVGQVLGVVDALPLSKIVLDGARAEKMAKAERVKLALAGDE